MYYIIPVYNFNIQDSIESIKNIQGANKVTALLHNDLSQIFRVPFIQKYNGSAMIVTSLYTQDQYIDLDKIIENKAMVATKNRDISIINCGHEFFKKMFSPSSIVRMDTREKLGYSNEDIYLDDTLLEYFNKKEDIKFTQISYTSENGNWSVEESIK